MSTLAPETLFSLPHVIDASLIESRYRHVHHADALKLLEMARLKLLEHVGYPNDWFMERQLFLVISKISVVYKRELFAGPVTITCDSARLEGKALIIPQRILNDKGKVAVEAMAESMAMNGETKRAVPYPEEFLLRISNG